MLNFTTQLNYLAPSFSKLDQAWQDLLYTNCSNQLCNIDQQLNNLSTNNTIYPPQNQIFNALNLTSFKSIKVVILGQDPYHGKDEANGLAFWVEPHIKTPPSLRNIYKELITEYQLNPDAKFDLTSWANQGVLLLNSSLNVIKDQPNSLSKLGWEIVTDQIIKQINLKHKNVVFMLWGNYAKQKASLINSNDHLVLISTHPSPFSAHKGFLGCNHFVLANQYLVDHGNNPINWCS